MARRSESAAEREARARLKKRHEVELAAYNEFFSIEARRRQLLSELDGLEAEQGAAAATLAEVSDAVSVASVIDWSPSKVRAAAKLAAPEEVGDAGVAQSGFVAGACDAGWSRSRG